MIGTVLAVGAGVLGTAGLAVLGILAYRVGAQSPPVVVSEPVPSSTPDDLPERVQELERLMEVLPQRWDDVRDETRKLANRAAYYARRAKTLVDEHELEIPAVDDLAQQFLALDGDGGEGEELHAVPDGMDASAEGATPFVMPSWAETERAMLHAKWAKRGRAG